MPSISHFTAQGGRSYQEDRYTITEHADGTLLCVFDGHGGADCAGMLKAGFAKAFLKFYETEKKPKRAIRQAFAQLAKETRNQSTGSTASVVWIPTAADTATIAILGDSPVLAGNKRGYHVSPDHNARTNPKERARAENKGALYIGGYLCKGFGGHGLQMGRAFGDSSLASFLSRIPEVYEYPIHDFILVATDGAFDPGHTQVNNEAKKITELIRGGGDARAVVNRAVAVPTGDNVTAILWTREARLQITGGK